MNTQTRLILVEGQPFTGKSTLSEFVTGQMARSGRAARWVPEGTMLQRYFPRMMATLDAPESLSEETLREEWSAFARAVAEQPETLIVDSALSYAAVGPLMAADRPRETLHAELRHFAELCAPLNPRVIHLTGDAARLVPASIEERGEGWKEHLVRMSEENPYQRSRGRTGVEGAILMQAESQALMQEVLDRDGWQAITVDVTATPWPTPQRAILEFLGLPEAVVETVAVPRDLLESYIGTYTAEKPEWPDQTLFVRLEGESLVLHVPNQRYGTLQPLSETRFHLRAAPVDIEFGEDTAGVRGLTLTITDREPRWYRLKTGNGNAK